MWIKEHVSLRRVQLFLHKPWQQHLPTAAALMFPTFRNLQSRPLFQQVYYVTVQPLYFTVQAFAGRHILPLSPGTAHRGLTTWLRAMASWEWNVECCVCRAPFPASLTAQAHANDQYYWSTIDGLATKQEKLITTKALLSFNYWSSMAISAAQRCSPTLISNKMWCRWKNFEDER